MINVAVSGAAGRMGRLILREVSQQEDMSLVGAFEEKSHHTIGKNVGELIGAYEVDITIAEANEENIDNCDVLIEFSSPQATVSHAQLAASRGKTMVIGTTGIDEEGMEVIKKCSSQAPILISANMSVGVNLLFKLAGEVGKILGSEYDIEIIEAHHRLKKDAPSGTAEKLAQILAKSAGRKLEEVVQYGRSGVIGERAPDTIGIHSVRGGSIVGDHTVIFAGPAERIELTHRGENRELFARGAIKATRFIVKQSPGLYNMLDALGLKEKLL